VVIMSNIQWVFGLKPESMTLEWRDRVRELFLQETDELYKDSSIINLAIPEWDGNLMLIDQDEYPNPASLKGLLWCKPFLEDTVRVVAFVIVESLQAKGFGSIAWNIMTRKLKIDGKSHVQLEVKSSNIKAQEFYRKRDMEIISRIDMYYKDEHGYMMRGKL
jgi:ribosomal protein S18 acetylase RimI-like enzyme